MNLSKKDEMDLNTILFVEPKLWSFVCFILLSTAAVVANLLLIFAMINDPLKCFGNATSYFVFNLAMSDFLNSLFIMEDSLLWLTKFRSVQGLPKTWMIINIGLFETMILVNFTSLFSLALERCLGIVFPLWHKVHVTQKVCRAWIAAVWSLMTIFGTVRYTYSIYYNDEQVYKHLGIVPWLLSFLATIVCYSIASFSVRRRRLALKKTTAISGITFRSNQIRLRNENQFLSTIFIITIVLIFGVALGLILHCVKYNIFTMNKNDDVTYLYDVADMLLLLNFFVNPFIYLWRLPKYRKTFQMLYCRRRNRTKPYVKENKRRT